MIINASYTRVTMQSRNNIYQTRISHIVKNALKKNKRITITTSEKNIIKQLYDSNSIHTVNANTIQYASYDTHINNMYEELTNEILSDIESCVYDYPEGYVSIITSENNNLKNKTETYLIHCPE